MKKLLLSLFAASLTLAAFSQVSATQQEPAAQWFNIIDSKTTSGDNATSVDVAADDCVYWLGTYGSTESLPTVMFNGTDLFNGALYNAGNSVNNNFTLIKTSPSGEKLWTVYSNCGDFAPNSGFCAATADGGVVAVSKVRHTDGMLRDNINLVDASDTDCPVEWSCERRSYRILVTKISADGLIEWNRLIDCATSSATADSDTFWADCFNLGGGAVDDSGNIYIALNYRSTLSIPASDGSNVSLSPVNCDSWNGDSQSSAGDFLLLALDSNGYYRNNLQLYGSCAASYCQSVLAQGTSLYIQGYAKASASGSQLRAGSFDLTPSEVFSPIIIKADTNLSVDWVKCFPGEPVGGKSAFQSPNLGLVNGSLFFTGQYNLKICDPDNSALSVEATQGTLREGFIIKLDPSNGDWLAARNSRDDDWNNPSAVAKTGLTGYTGVVPDPADENKIYVYGYVMNAGVGVFLRSYNAENLVADLPDGQYNIISAGGVPSCQCAAYDSANAALYICARGNKAFNLMPDLSTPAFTTWGILTARFDLPHKATGIDSISDADGIELPTEYYTLQGIRVDGPTSPGIYICRKGASVSKQLIK